MLILPVHEHGICLHLFDILLKAKEVMVSSVVLVPRICLVGDGVRRAQVRWEGQVGGSRDALAAED